MSREKPHDTPDIHNDPVADARSARLRYVSDERPGIRRERQKGSEEFRYLHPDGSAVTDAKTLERIQSLAIPPAWKDVWISTVPNGHLQATGRDDKGRKQYRYHPRWRAVRDSNKYDRMVAFGEALPHIRARVDHDLARPGLPREKILATIVRLLEKTRIRVGNEEYAQANGSFGLTTLRNDHVDVSGSKLHFHFRGKSGKEHEIDLRDKRVARVVARLHDLEGQELFQWVERQGGGETLHHVSSGDVNGYLRETAGEEFTAKDFRTWSGTVLCALCLMSGEAAETEAQAKHRIVEAIKEVSQRLGNTPAICRKSYIHPVVLQSFLDGSMTGDLKLPKLNDTDTVTIDADDLSAEEKAVLAFLRKRSVAAKQ